MASPVTPPEVTASGASEPSRPDQSAAEIISALERGFEDSWSEDEFLHVKRVLEALIAQRDDLIQALRAVARNLRGDYVKWHSAGGPEECAHGFAAGIPCPSCDRITIGNAIARYAVPHPGLQPSYHPVSPEGSPA